MSDGWCGFITGFIAGGFGCLLFLIAMGATPWHIKNNYAECVALGAPADNCLKKYVLRETHNQKGE